MHIAETKTTTAARNKVKTRQKSFFNKKEREGFFPKSNEASSFFFAPAAIQPKLTIGQPDDKYAIQRKCAECEKEERLQKKPESFASPTAPVQIESSLNASKGGGNTLPTDMKTEMENSFGVDFSRVRLHIDSRAVQMNNDLHAQAFTHGSDIYFNAGKCDTSSLTGKHLLAHELTHVVQQGQLTPDSEVNKKTIQRQAASASSGSTTCGKPADCPSDFCTPFANTLIAQAVRAQMAPVLLAGIATKISTRVVPLWRQYIFGGAAPQDISGDFGGDFTTSLITADTTDFLISVLRNDLTNNPPVFPPGVSVTVVDIPSRIPAAISEIGTVGSSHPMDFNIITEIPGNIAGSIGTTQLSCPVGARPSPFDDSRSATGTAIVVLNPDGTLTVFPFINYTVKDTIDLCPGNCGSDEGLTVDINIDFIEDLIQDSGLISEQTATIPLSRMEASGISGDVPFTVNFPSLPIPPFTITPVAPSPVPTPSPDVNGTITASSLRIRQRPNLSSTIIGSYPNGTIVNIDCKTTGSSVEGNTTWYQTDRGFISGQYVNLTGSVPSDC